MATRPPPPLPRPRSARAATGTTPTPPKPLSLSHRPTADAPLPAPSSPASEADLFDAPSLWYDLSLDDGSLDDTRSHDFFSRPHPLHEPETPPPPPRCLLDDDAEERCGEARRRDGEAADGCIANGAARGGAPPPAKRRSAAAADAAEEDEVLHFLQQHNSRVAQAGRDAARKRVSARAAPQKEGAGRRHGARDVTMPTASSRARAAVVEERGGGRRRGGVPTCTVDLIAAALPCADEHIERFSLHPASDEERGTDGEKRGAPSGRDDDAASPTDHHPTEAAMSQASPTDHHPTEAAISQASPIDHHPTEAAIAQASPTDHYQTEAAISQAPRTDHHPTDAAAAPPSERARAGSALPDELYCPLTGELMVEPVSTVDGYVFERRAIEAWLLRQCTNPLTRAPLPCATLVPNLPLAKLIRAMAPRPARAAGRQATPPAPASARGDSSPIARTPSPLRLERGPPPSPAASERESVAGEGGGATRGGATRREMLEAWREQKGKGKPAAARGSKADSPPRVSVEAAPPPPPVAVSDWASRRDAVEAARAALAAAEAKAAAEEAAAREVAAGRGERMGRRSGALTGGARGRGGGEERENEWGVARANVAAPPREAKAAGKERGDAKDMALLEMLRSHNAKFATKPKFEPRTRSVAQVRDWEKRTGLMYGKLSYEEREAANKEITAWLQEQSGVA
ncbi:hypothetical protein AB1Y20_002752 [Prymnesium parvum]|uniref:U-box domain-containing protein n=1 Tax=Prymnesium parvum TaxID=97485 RepID=A0AB34J8U9_PRYPA